MAKEKTQKDSGDEAKEKKGKKDVRVWTKNLACPEPECGDMVHHDSGTREYFIDVNVPINCKRCGKAVAKALVESATDKLTAEESKRQS